MGGRIKRLPAFGRDLMLARRNGKDPAIVDVLVGDDWTRDARRAAVALRCEHWQPDRIDWTPCAGLPVLIHERGPHRYNAAPHATCLVERIGAELILVASMVEILFSNGERWEIERWAHLQRLDDPARCWPIWWSDSLADRAACARARYLDWFGRLPNERFLSISRELLA
jgi:hypothetical protein